MGFIDAVLRDPLLRPVGPVLEVGLRVGTVDLNIDDLRDLMRRLAATRTLFEIREGFTAETTVTLRTEQATYSMDQLGEVGAAEWGGEWTIQAGLMLLARDRDGIVTIRPDPIGPWVRGEGQFAEGVSRVEAVLASAQERPISARGRRRLAATGVAVAALGLWLWAMLAASPPLAIWLLSIALTAAVTTVLVERVLAAARDPRAPHLARSRVTVTSTSRREMDQRRHDRRRDWRVIGWTLLWGAPVSGLIGSLISVWALG